MRRLLCCVWLVLVLGVCSALQGGAPETRALSVSEMADTHVSGNCLCAKNTGACYYDPDGFGFCDIVYPTLACADENAPCYLVVEGPLQNQACASGGSQDNCVTQNSTWCILWQAAKCVTHYYPLIQEFSCACKDPSGEEYEEGSSTRASGNPCP
jgi:hypothetical protein